MKRIILALLAVGLLAPAWSQPAKIETSINDMRGDTGVLEDFGPRGVAWMPDGHLFVVDRRYNAFHTFDEQGRRWRMLGYPLDNIGVCFYNGLARLDDKVMYAIGSHYHIKNDARFLSARSVTHKIQMNGEGTFTDETCKVNLDPDSAFRATGYYGDSAKQRLEVSGMAMDKKHNRVFVGCSMPLAEDGTVLVFTGPLDKFIAGDKTFRFEQVKTGLKPETDKTTGAQCTLQDMDYVDEKGLVLLMGAFSGEDMSDHLRFGASQIWFLPAGFGPAKPILKDLCPGNRGTGITIKPLDKWTYTAAIVCDNDMEDTKVPSRMIIVKGLQFPLK